MVVAVGAMTALCEILAAFESAGSAAWGDCVGWVVLRVDSCLDGNCWLHDSDLRVALCRKVLWFLPHSSQVDLDLHSENTCPPLKHPKHKRFSLIMLNLSSMVALIKVLHFSIG